jgi:AbrB family looped-hinge helix DNA binding protein
MKRTVTVKVTRKGQVTIPVEFRKQHGISEGDRVNFRQSKAGLILEPVPNIADLAGVDSKIITTKEAIKKLDESRANDRY